MVDYSKWKKIEISDDEDDTHPNIDTPSLFRWRHQARLQRQEEQRKANEEVEKKRALLKQKLQEQENEKEKELSEEERQKLAEELAETERKEKELQKRQARQPWNVDTIGQETWSGTVLNKNVLNKPKTQEEITYEKEADVIGYEGHVAAYEAEMRQFAFQANFEERRRYLVAHPNLVHQYTVDYLSLWCISLKLEGKQALLECVARQAVTIQMILSLASTLGGGIDPRSCLGVFFERSARAKAKFECMFEDELAEFMERVSKAEQYRLEKALAEQEKDPQALIGPGGLNAQEVFESLPEQLQECFQTRSHEHIERVLGAMDPEEAEYHLKRCIDAGLWSVEAGKDDVDEDEQLIAAMARSSLKDNEDKVDGSGGDADSSSSLSEEE